MARKRREKVGGAVDTMAGSAIGRWRSIFVCEGGLGAGRVQRLLAQEFLTRKLPRPLQIRRIVWLSRTAFTWKNLKLHGQFSRLQASRAPVMTIFPSRGDDDLPPAICLLGLLLVAGSPLVASRAHPRRKRKKGASEGARLRRNCRAAGRSVHNRDMSKSATPIVPDRGRGNLFSLHRHKIHIWERPGERFNYSRKMLALPRRRFDP